MLTHADFCKYVPAINAFLNGNTDTVAKSWSETVDTFFAKNKDETFNDYANMAYAFAYSPNPTWFGIPARVAEAYIDAQRITIEYLEEKEFEEDVDYMKPRIRITFDAFRRLIFDDKTHVSAFSFIDKMFKMYRRYTTVMITRMKLNTHWTLIERVAVFSRTMSPHLPTGRGVALMKEQPIVLVIRKGSSKKVRAGLAACKKKNLETVTFADNQFVPMYESVMMNANDELDLIIKYLNDDHVKPYRANQLKVNPSIKPAHAQYNVKTSKSMILIDPSQESYTPEKLKEDITRIRSEVKQGIIPIVEFDKTDLQKHVSIEHFLETKGEYIDELHEIKLSPSYEDITLVFYEFEDTELLNTPIVLESECGSDAETVMSVATTKPKKAAGPSKKPDPVVIEEEEEEEKPAVESTRGKKKVEPKPDSVKSEEEKPEVESARGKKGKTEGKPTAKPARGKKVEPKPTSVKSEEEEEEQEPEPAGYGYSSSEE